MARKPFVVLDAEILSSSLWSEDKHVRLVWITLLVLCDTEGYVGASVPGIARAAGVTLDEAREAIELLQRPDPDSRTTANDGRRLEPAERGFRVLNFIEHLDRLSVERKNSRERVRRWREHGWKGNSKQIPEPRVGESCPCCCEQFKTPLKKYVVLDHDHKTGKGRAYVCQSCNRRIQLVEDGKRNDGYILEYLAKHRPVTETAGNVDVMDSCLGTSEQGTGTSDDEESTPPSPPPAGVLLEQLACPACQVRGALIRERPAAGRTSPGWHCWPKQGGCGAYFEITEPRILSRLTPRVRDSIRRLVDVPRSPEPVLPTPTEEAQAAEALAVWLPLMDALKDRVGVHPWATWIRPLRAIRLADKELVLEAPNSDFRAWVLANHVAHIRAVAAEAGLKVGLVLPGEVHSGS